MFVAFIFLLTSMGTSVFAAVKKNFTMKLNPPTFSASDTHTIIKEPKSLGVRITIPTGTILRDENIRFEITGSAFTVNKFYLTNSKTATASAVAVPAISVITSSPNILPQGRTFSVPVYIGIVSGAALSAGDTITVTATAPKDITHEAVRSSAMIKVGGVNATKPATKPAGGSSVGKPATKPAGGKPAAGNQGTKPAAGNQGTKPAGKPSTTNTATTNSSTTNSSTTTKPEDKPGQTGQTGQTADSGKSSVDTFNDVKPTDWFRADVEYAVKNGIFNGTSAGKFSPDAPMT
ncbi:MAG: S-layer homology domain-containing protein, partial [Clostridiales Family XIII bacterium]|nr:S-layer homology domain-containing protein [Clostridiales Family XIII bacterium]